MTNSMRKWRLGLCIVTGTFFCLSLVILVHDSLGLSKTASDSEIHEIATSRPILFDLFGHPMKVGEREYQRALLQGDYRVRPGSTIAMLSPRNELAVVDVRQAPLALVRGWSVEPLEHALGRVIQANQDAYMWLGNDPDLWFQSALFWVSVMLLCGTLLLVSESEIWESEI